MAADMIYLEGGSFQMGSESPDQAFEIDMEGPSLEVQVKPFEMDATTVTNADFAEFFYATGYVTEAERYGSSHVFFALLDEDKQDLYPLAGGTDWWHEVPEACWRKPEGSGSTIADRMDHPVTRVSWNDAMAYAYWAGKRLPTESEWEYAARGGHAGLVYPWGNELNPEGQYLANTWQGDFPNENTLEDGYLGTAPAKHYPANDPGFYQMIGNVWEWCLNPGRIPLSNFQEKSSLDFLKENHQYATEYQALRGGSFLCHASYCRRYRNAGRNATAANTSTSNIGFRCVRDVV